MIIQCEKCQTKFRLDDSRVTDKGVKVRCTKCKYVFKVQKEQQEAELFESSTVVVPGLEATAVQVDIPAPPIETSLAVAPSVSDVSFDTENTSDKNNLPSETIDFSQLDASSFEAITIAFETENLHTEKSKETQTSPDTSSVRSGEVDFSDFDFGDSDVSSYETPFTAPADTLTESMIAAPAKSDQKEAPQGLDFSDDDMFGAVVQTLPETPSEAISFEFEGDSFAESMDMNSRDANVKRGTLFSLDTPGEAPFSLGEIDFGDELTAVAIQQVNPEDLKPSQEILFAPLAETQNKLADDELKRSFSGVESDVASQDLPPLSIASRRKQSPLFGALIAASALLVIAVLGYFGYTSYSTSTKTASLDTGKISVSAVTAKYIRNSHAGELLVISGEARNEYPKPRAALQIKVTVFDATGQSVATKMAYGGNPLTTDQLETLPLDKIEVAMANQFGDSLANMEVAPGKAIPFVVIVANLPKGAKDFAVQSAGSTVATGKQQ